MPRSGHITILAPHFEPAITVIFTGHLGQFLSTVGSATPLPLQSEAVLVGRLLVTLPKAGR